MSSYLIPGDKVHYAPKPHMFVRRFENGIIHSQHPNPFLRYVVFYSPKGWDKYLDEKPMEIGLDLLREGWTKPSTIN